MRILISNDDGVTAPGLAALYAALADYAEKSTSKNGVSVRVAAQDISRAINSLTAATVLPRKRATQAAISTDCILTRCIKDVITGAPIPITKENALKASLRFQQQ